MNQDFQVRVEDIPATDKSKSNKRLDRVDAMAARKGYASRAPRKLGRPRASNPRTKQIHAWVHPQIREEVLAESMKRGIHQGALLEEAWEYYKKYAISTN